MHFSIILSYFLSLISSLFFFNDPATTEIYTLSLHDALPIYLADQMLSRTFRFKDFQAAMAFVNRVADLAEAEGDRKSTRLNSSHVEISYAVFCLKKKKK